MTILEGGDSEQTTRRNDRGRDVLDETVRVAWSQQHCQ